jgi:hypothetical protein
MNTKSRRVIYGSRIEGAKIHADDTRERAMQAVREADRAEAEAWSIRMEGYGGGGPRRSRPRRSRNASTAATPGSCASAARRGRASLSTAIRRPRDTAIWNLEVALKCRSCKKGRYAPPVHMIKLTEAREITPCVWVHPDEER